MTESINYEAVCRTAPATPGLSKTVGKYGNTSVGEKRENEGSTPKEVS